MCNKLQCWTYIHSQYNVQVTREMIKACEDARKELEKAIEPIKGKKQKKA